jgi:hypothetical protein
VAPSSQPPADAASTDTTPLAGPPRVAVTRPTGLEGMADWMPLPSGPPTTFSAHPATPEATVSLGQLATTIREVRREIPSFTFDAAADRASFLETTRDNARVMGLEQQLREQN